MPEPGLTRAHRIYGQARPIAGQHPEPIVTRQTKLDFKFAEKALDVTQSVGPGGRKFGNPEPRV